MYWVYIYIYEYVYIYIYHYISISIQRGIQKTIVSMFTRHVISCTPTWDFSQFATEICYPPMITKQVPGGFILATFRLWVPHLSRPVAEKEPAWNHGPSSAFHRDGGGSHCGAPVPEHVLLGCSQGSAPKCGGASSSNCSYAVRVSVRWERHPNVSQWSFRPVQSIHGPRVCPTNHHELSWTIMNHHEPSWSNMASWNIMASWGIMKTSWKHHETSWHHEASWPTLTAKDLRCC